MRLFLYIFGHNGDIHFIREYIKDIISKTNFDEYYLLHNNNENDLLDVPNLKIEKLNEYCYSNYNQTDFKYTNINDEDIYINITALDFKQEHFYKLFRLVYDKLLIKFESYDFYIPTIDYQKYEISGVNDYINKNKDKFKILFSNGNILSWQTSFIDYEVIVDKLSDEFKNIHFILTKKLNIEKENVFYTDDIINIRKKDLNEISYLSTYCDIIVGSSSGPFIYTLVKENLKNYNKKFIYICSDYKYIYFENTLSSKILITDERKVYDLIQKELKIENSSEEILIIRKNREKGIIDVIPINYCDENIIIDFYADNGYYKNNEELINLIDGPIHKLNMSMATNYWLIPYKEYNNESKIKVKFYYKNKMYIKNLK
jgi:hypothetical protein